MSSNESVSAFPGTTAHRVDETDDAVDAATETTLDYVTDAPRIGEAVDELGLAIRAGFDETVNTVRHIVREKPLVALLAMGAAGYLFGRLRR